MKILKTLKILHAKGIIHRDIKPNNVIRSSDGQYFLIDFGVSKIETHEPTAQDLGQAATTPVSPWYTPAEQMHGYATNRSDFFSLAITCYYLLFKSNKATGPFQDQQLKGVLEKMSNPFQELRYATADEILAVLQAKPYNDTS